jgi:hypothetical protein
MKKAEIELIVLIGVILSLLIGSAIWWVPQKWEACSNQFDNIILRLACMD